MIHIIDKVSLTSNGLVATGTKDLIHLHQGDMDGACAVYSLMMCLIINRSIKRLDVTDLDKKHDGRSSKGRLVDTFLNNAKGLVREGYELEVLNTELLHAFKKCVSTAWYSTENYCCPLNFKTTRFPYPQRPSIGVADSFFEK